MSSFAVTVETITVSAHPDPEVVRLEVARVGQMGYEAVVPKGAFVSGQLVGYIPESAVLADPQFVDALGLTGLLAGKDRNRVKPKRLRGVLSQGIVFDLETARPWLGGGFDPDAAHAAGVDLACCLPVVKWVPVVPASMSGQVEPAPELIRWIDIESRFRFPDVFRPGERVHVSEKVHSSCLLVTTDVATGELWVSSKGFGGKNLALVEDDRNVYWRAVRAHRLDEAAAAVAEATGAVRVGLFGEVYGAGVQDLGYGRARGDYGYACFDGYIVDATGSGRWLEQAELRELLPGWVATVPCLYEGLFDEAAILALADGSESVSGTAAHIREGVVVRAVPERRSDLLGGRAIVKYVSADYLTRQGGTEYE